MKTEYTCVREKAGRDAYLPFILQHRKMPDGYGGRCRKPNGKTGVWGLQVR